ncbi:hypothetical protein [Pseudomonas citronellolis]|uniref:hypothetical protein n=1 Tax=Pseudomonas citronellolis TaxID=53408 RepID=UPI000778C163|nr:hypothetical protein [Pseudomonas citronellolis]AMO78074.1 hypothetical protein PcP3B5_46820 [Pseudomonas citronellolis]
MTMAMELIRHIAGLYSGKAIKGDFTQVYITGNEIWMAQQILASQQAEGAQGDLDEYAEFESWLEREKPAGCVGDMERGWMARAARAQPPSAPDLDDQSFDDNAERLTRDALGPGAGINPNATSIDDLFLDETPAPELERPEVMAVLVLGGVFDGGELGDNDIVTVNPAIERLQAALVTDGEVLVELMTVAQHERIVGALREKIDGAESQAEYQTRRAEHFAKERDAVLSRLAELEKQAPVAAVSEETFSADGTSDIITRNLPIGTMLYAAPVAQAGQVPEEVREAVEWADHLLFECGALVQTRAPSVHVYNKAFAAIEAAKTLLAGAPAKGGE